MQDDETIQVTFLSYEIEAKDTTQSADIAITLAISCEEMLIDVVHEYLQQISEQQNLAKYSRVVDNVWYDLEL